MLPNTLDANKQLCPSGAYPVGDWDWMSRCHCHVLCDTNVCTANLRIKNIKVPGMERIRVPAIEIVSPKNDRLISIR